MKKFLSFLVNVILVLCIVLAVVTMITVGINAQKGKVTTVGGLTMMIVQTGSMEPEYPVGCMVLAQKTDPRSLKEGDVISFYSSDPDLNEMVVTHRITKVNYDGRLTFTTKGDANVLEDKYPAKSDDLIGKVIIKSKFLGKIQNIREKPATFFFILVVPMIAIITYEFITVSKKLKGANGADKKNEKDPS